MATSDTISIQISGGLQFPKLRDITCLENTAFADVCDFKPARPRFPLEIVDRACPVMPVRSKWLLGRALVPPERSKWSLALAHYYQGTRNGCSGLACPGAARALESARACPCAATTLDIFAWTFLPEFISWRLGGDISHHTIIIYCTAAAGCFLQKRTSSENESAQCDYLCCKGAFRRASPQTL